MTLEQLILYCEQFPDDALLHFSTGNKYYEMGESHYNSALFYLERAIQLDSNHLASLFVLGNIYSDMGKISEAKKLFQHALAIIPQLEANQGQDLEPAIRDALENLEF